MTRRETLATLMGKKKTTSSKQERQASNITLSSYTGSWSNEQAAHLLRRTMYGATKEQIEEATQNGMMNTINQLLSSKNRPNPPINYNEPLDIYAPIGQTWVEKPLIGEGNKVRASRTRSLYAWTIKNMMEEGMSIIEKMTLFWHNHFPIEINVVNDPRFIYKYSSLIREYALGNFKALVKKMTLNVAMLRYLNGNQNTKQSPNENYARELLELFTIGKGALAGSGDYTTFTETDVAAMAKILTGWIDRGYNTYDPSRNIEAIFVPNRHETGNKQLSHRFNNVVISNADEQEYSNLIDVIFEQEEVSKFICRKLYRWFVYYEVSPEEEAHIITPLAQILRDNNYEIKPVLEALFNSEHFYHNDNIGCLIKNPLDFFMDIFKKFNIQLPDSLITKYQIWFSIFGITPVLQMSYFNPPNVAGWKAFYQEPLFNRIWINSSTLKFRLDIISYMVYVGIDEGGDQNILIDVLDFVSRLQSPEDPNELIKEIAQIIFIKPVTNEQVTYLKNFIIPGLPDFEWTVEYSDYLSHPDDMQIRVSVENKLKSLINTMLSMPEFQLS